MKKLITLGDLFKSTFVVIITANKKKVYAIIETIDKRSKSVQVKILPLLVNQQQEKHTLLYDSHQHQFRYDDQKVEVYTLSANKMRDVYHAKKLQLIQLLNWTVSKKRKALYDDPKMSVDIRSGELNSLADEMFTKFNKICDKYDPILQDIQDAAKK